MQRTNWLLHPQKVFQDQIHLLQNSHTLNTWQTCVSDGTEFHCHVPFNVTICVKSRPSNCHLSSGKQKFHVTKSG